MDEKRSSEKGQVLILLVLGFVILLGFAALAIDGGMVYADRRRDQNGADASSLAGGGAAALSLDNSYVDYFNWNCTGSGQVSTEIQEAMAAARAAAISRGAVNSFSLIPDLDGNTIYLDNSVATRCGSYNNGSWIDKYIDITTTITSTTSTNFAHLIYGGPLRNRVRAVVRVRPRGPIGYGNAIVALNPAGCVGQQNGAKFHGTPEMYVYGGGIFTNGCLRNDGQPNGETPAVVVITGTINYVGERTGNAPFIPDPQQVTYPLPESAFAITNPCNISNPNTHYINNPRQLLNTPQPLHGLYCVSGDLRVNNNDTMIGDGITLVMLDGSITINGGAVVQITAPAKVPNPAPAVPGLLIYLPPQNPPPQEEIKINGNAADIFQGTILAPHADVTLLGAANQQAFHTQVIGWNVEAGGNNGTVLTYEGGEQFSGPAFLDMYR